MNPFKSSPLTSFAGAGTIAYIALDLAYYWFIEHRVSPNAWNEVIGLFTGGGLIAAKDFNVTGGTQDTAGHSRYDPRTGAFL